MGLSHLNEHTFRHNFRSGKYATFFLHCQHYSTFRMALMNQVNHIDENFSCLPDDNKVSLLLYCDSRFDDNKNNFILTTSITYALEAEIFSTSSFQSDV